MGGVWSPFRIAEQPTNKDDLSRSSMATISMNTNTPGPLSLLVVDATANVGKWEHAATDALWTALQACKVPCAQPGPAKVDDVGPFQAAFTGAITFNAAIILAHGSVGKNGVLEIDIGSVAHHVYEFEHMELNLADKFVMLVICEGYTDDSIEAFIKGQTLGLALLGTPERIGGQDVVDFFPPFLEAIVGQNRNSINYDDVVIPALEAHRQRSKSAVCLHYLGRKY